MVDLVDERDALSDIEKNSLSATVQKALDFVGLKNDTLTIVLSDDNNLQELNSKFSGNNYPTDVLSFSANEVDPITGQNYLGDIIISVERAASQAATGDITLSKEITTLIVHGILHLCGYDHAEEKDHREMFAMQTKIIDSLSDE
jgi:probable rRNA maturation factor